MDIYESSPVISQERLGEGEGSLIHLRTPEGSVTAPKMILAVNGHAQSFGYFKQRFMHVFTYASMTRPLNRMRKANAWVAKAEWDIIPAEPMGSTVRRMADDRILIRNRFTYDASMEVSESQGRPHGPGP